MPEWLERELSAGLAPVHAPEELRDRMFQPRRMTPARRVSPYLIAAAMVMLSVGTVWLSSREPVRVSNARWSVSARASAGDHNCQLCHTF